MMYIPYRAPKTDAELDEELYKYREELRKCREQGTLPERPKEVMPWLD